MIRWEHGIVTFLLGNKDISTNQPNRRKYGFIRKLHFHNKDTADRHFVKKQEEQISVCTPKRI